MRGEPRVTQRRRAPPVLRSGKQSTNARRTRGKPDNKYSAYAGAEPYFELVRKALEDLVDGEECRFSASGACRMFSRAPGTACGVVAVTPIGQLAISWSD